MKKYYGILIAIIPFITGSYTKLSDWSTSEMVGYNIFNVGLIVFGLYLVVRNFVKNKNDDKK